MIVVEHLVRRFGKLTAVDDISFTVQKGEIFAFLGPNGAGKSTTIRMLTTLLRPSGGRILFDGIDVAQDPGAVRKRFGIVFQDASVDGEMTAWENLDLHGILYRVPRRTRHARIEELLAAFGLSARRNDRVKLFSGGMRRRLEIARSFVHAPAVIFLDEPTLGLDPQTRAHLWSQIRAMNAERQTTVFLTTHYMDEVERFSTRAAIIDHGRIIASGTPLEIIRHSKSTSLEQAYLSLTGARMRENGSIPETCSADAA